MERYLNKEFKIINVVVFGKHTTNVHDSTCTINVEGSKVSLSLHNMTASEASLCFYIFHPTLTYGTKGQKEQENFFSPLFIIFCFKLQCRTNTFLH
jgi:hypothetical protein